MLFIIRDLCQYKLYDLSHKVVLKDKNASFIVVEYVNRYMDAVNLSKILRNKSVMALFPNTNERFSCPTTSFKYSSTIRSSITNYKDVYMDTSNSTCACDLYDSKFKDPHYQHIITGDINIIKNRCY